MGAHSRLMVLASLRLIVCWMDVKTSPLSPTVVCLSRCGSSRWSRSRMPSPRTGRAKSTQHTVRAERATWWEEDLISIRIQDHTWCRERVDQRAGLAPLSRRRCQGETSYSWDWKDMSGLNRLRDPIATGWHADSSHHWHACTERLSTEMVTSWLCVQRITFELMDTASGATWFHSLYRLSKRVMLWRSWEPCKLFNRLCKLSPQSALLGIARSSKR